MGGGQVKKATKKATKKAAGKPAVSKSPKSVKTTYPGGLGRNWAPREK